MSPPEPRSIFDKDNPDGIFPHLANFEGTLKLPPGFCEALVNEDDWSFIIKLHALFEAALTSLLVTTVGDARLHDAFSRLEMSRSETGKVDFAKALELVDRLQRRFIRTLSELRNRLIHRIENVTFTLREYVASLDPSQKAAFLESFAPWTGEKRGEDYESFKNHAPANLKTLIWVNGLLIVATMMVQVESIRYRRETETQIIEFGKAQIQHLTESKGALQRLFDKATSTGTTSDAQGPRLTGTTSDAQ